VAQFDPDDILADFSHCMRQPLSALEALTAYLELITAGRDPRIQEQLCRMHSQIALAEQTLCDGVRKLRPYLASAEHRPEGAPPEPAVVEELTRPLTKAAMASVTN